MMFSNIKSNIFIKLKLNFLKKLKLFPKSQNIINTIPIFKSSMVVHTYNFKTDSTKVWREEQAQEQCSLLTG